jgi:hypothetical protein
MPRLTVPPNAHSWVRFRMAPRYHLSSFSKAGYSVVNPEMAWLSERRVPPLLMNRRLIAEIMEDAVPVGIGPGDTFRVS